MARLTGMQKLLANYEHPDEDPENLPYRWALIDVILIAGQDLTGPRGRDMREPFWSRYVVRAMLDAYQWFFDGLSEEFPLSYEWCCANLGMPPEACRRYLRKRYAPYLSRIEHTINMEAVDGRYRTRLGVWQRAQSVRGQHGGRGVFARFYSRRGTRHP
ncbi:MAG: hypothetical protein Q7U76_12790 [Nitrospirota bacterium]|nr:hypothetical protein [Nitrospirota bacterium]